MKYMLVILASASSCNLSNIDHAEPSVAVFQSKTECDDVALAIDPRPNIRSFCIEVPQ